MCCLFCFSIWWCHTKKKGIENSGNKGFRIYPVQNLLTASFFYSITAIFSRCFAVYFVFDSYSLLLLYHLNLEILFVFSRIIYPGTSSAKLQAYIEKHIFLCCPIFGPTVATGKSPRFMGIGCCSYGRL